MDMTRRALLGAPFVLRGQSRRPNILFLLADDQRWDTLGAFGNREVRTPNLDKLAARGTSFHRAFIMGGNQGAVCAPSRAALMTGRPYLKLPLSVTNPGRQMPDCPYPTMPETFGKAGYRTFATGKWHNGPKLFARSFQGGDSIFFGGMSDHDKVPVNAFDPSGRYPKESISTGAKFSSELFSDAAIGFLENHKSADPFFCYVAYTAPHDPRMAPREFADLYPPDRIALPKNFAPEHPFDNGDMRLRDEQLAPWPRTPEIVRQHIAAYYAMITHLDQHVGRVLTALEKTGRAKDTIVVFAADNGLAVGQHGLLGKQNVYDHSARIPMILAGPGVPRGQVRRAMCYLHDMFATLAPMAGVKTPESVDGANLARALANPKDNLRDSVLLTYRNFQRAVRTDRHKLILYNVNGKRTTQLFDLVQDPWETRNLAGDPKYAALTASLTERLKEEMRHAGDSIDIARDGWEAARA